MENAVAVIGSANMDIGGYPSEPLSAGDSNPGRVRMSIGGVGCNIARNLAQLSVPVRFVTALGGDVYARDIERALAGAGIDLSLSLRLPNERTSTYLFITDERGDMAVAVNDMSCLLYTSHPTMYHQNQFYALLSYCRRC